MVGWVQKDTQCYSGSGPGLVREIDTYLVIRAKEANSHPCNVVFLRYFSVSKHLGVASHAVSQRGLLWQLLRRMLCLRVWETELGFRPMASIAVETAPWLLCPSDSRL